MEKFNKKINIFSQNILKICIYIKNHKGKTEEIFTKKVYSELITTSRLLEDFLDYHGAKNNKEWFFFRELIASVEHLSLGAYSQKHIKNRLPFYKLETIVGFELDMETTSNFFQNTLYKITLTIIDEAKKLKIKMPKGRYKKEDFPRLKTDDLLEDNIEALDEENKHQENIVKISNNFINMIKEFDNFIIYEQFEIDKIKKMVPNKINVVEMRRFEMMVHNLQSYFDSYVISTGSSLRYTLKKNLLTMRGYFSIAFHLFQIIGRLLHYYERHLYDKGYKSTYKECATKLKELINVDDLLDCTINYGLYYTSFFLILGKKKTRKILAKNIEKASVTVLIPKSRGFHFRPSEMVASVVKHYGGNVVLKVKDKTFDAASTLEMTWAGGYIKQENIEKIIFEGDKRAVKDIKLLASLDYGEDIIGNDIALPPELSYL